VAWYLVAHYLPTALFSLKDSWATNAAGKTLLVPSPYAVKMALLDVAARWQGVEAAKAVFVWLKSLEVRPSPPQYACVTNSFIKIQRPPKKPKPGEPFGPTVAFREYIQFHGVLRIACEVSKLETESLEMLRSLLLRVNYFGKRGCFMQFLQFDEMEGLDESFITIAGDQKTSSGSVMHYLDDFGPRMTWDKVNVYTSDKPDREVKAALLPYRLRRSSKRSSLYVRVV
jgi:hypothetical protein